jgi:hypothetical protein
MPEQLLRIRMPKLVGSHVKPSLLFPAFGSDYQKHPSRCHSLCRRQGRISGVRGEM